MIATEDYAQRLSEARRRSAELGVEVLLVSPGPDLRYLCGYQAVPLERLTCLVIRADDDPFLVAPALELAAATASPIGALGVDVLTWHETEDPFGLTAARLGGPRLREVAVDNHMWAEKTLRFADLLPTARQSLGGVILAPMRARKSPAEVEELRIAGAAIDHVHARMGEWLRPGRTEREVGADIAAAIIDAGHEQVDFVIVGSGANGASPHHEVGDRVIRAGDPVVVDIGGTTRSGYCSDETRVYALGEPSPEFLASYAVLQNAQRAAVAAVRPGVTCAAIDAVARDHISAAGFGENFIHRTGHGIGMETHEDPYIVAGNDTVLEPGHAFSIEPGIYREGCDGARIEDIVVCGSDRGILMNNRPRELQILG